MPRWTMVATVPDMFHVPMSAPTARRMKMAPMAVEMLSTAALLRDSMGWPFQLPINPARIAQKMSATWTGPAVKSPP